MRQMTGFGEHARLISRSKSAPTSQQVKRDGPYSLSMWKKFISMSDNLFILTSMSDENQRCISIATQRNAYII